MAAGYRFAIELDIPPLIFFVRLIMFHHSLESILP